MAKGLVPEPGAASVMVYMTTELEEQIVRLAKKKGISRVQWIRNECLRVVERELRKEARQSGNR